MRKLLGVFIVLAFLMMWGPPSYASPDLYDWKTNIDGTVVDMPILGPSFDTNTGLGTVNLSVAGSGSHFVGLFLDQDTDLLAFVAGDSGQAVGAPPAGMSWEIGSPWDYSVDPAVPGQIIGDFKTGLTNQVLADILPPFPLGGDVSMAMGWSFNLGAGETANVGFLISSQAPTSGFYLNQFNLDNLSIPDEIFMSSTLEIRTSGVPEPGTLLLMGSGLLGLIGLRRRMNRKG